ncbi:MAG: protein BatD [Magnetococcales bacterium]|nr:protein BatD [Magnetococcales bacterium]MBF0438497.1 protein BatD [Magnetococcales bacterium]
MVKSQRSPVMLWAVLFWLLSSMAMAGEIHVRASRNPVALTDSFALTFESKESLDAEPNFSALEKDFEILDRSHKTNFQFINGQKSQSIAWILELMPKRSGNLVIPSIAFGKDQSPAVTISVVDQQPTGESAGHSGLVLEAELSAKSVQMQEQTILTVRFLRAVEIAKASMSEPKISTGDAIIEKLGEERSYETQRDGQRYLVNELRYALFPQRSGKMVLDPIPLTVQLPGQAGSNLLREFFNDPFIKNMPFSQGRPGRTVRLNTSSIELDVQPIPPEAAGKPWLPAHKILLEEKWSPDPPQFQVGEPVTRTLKLTADGLTAAQLPPISASSADGLKHYPDRPLTEDQKEATGIIGKRTEKIALIPSTSGTHILPAIEIPWWNTDTKTMEIARLPERQITVIGSSAKPAQEPKIVQPVPPTSVPVTAPAMEPAPLPVSTAGIWPWTTLAACLGWMITGLLWWRSRRLAPILPMNTAIKPLKEIKERLQAACLANDPVATRAALSQYPHGSSKALEEEIQLLNAALFGRLPSPWQGAGLWAALQAVTAQGDKKNNFKSEVLPPLYPS